MKITLDKLHFGFSVNVNFEISMRHFYFFTINKSNSKSPYDIILKKKKKKFLHTKFSSLQKKKNND